MRRGRREGRASGDLALRGGHVASQEVERRWGRRRHGRATFDRGPMDGERLGQAEGRHSAGGGVRSIAILQGALGSGPRHPDLRVRGGPPGPQLIRSVSGGSGRPLHARWRRSIAVHGRLLSDGLQLDRRRLFLVPPGFLSDRRERVVGDLEAPFDVFFRVLRADERALAGVRDAEEDIVPEAVDEPVPPPTRVRAQRVPEVSDLVFRREVDVPDGPDVFDPGRDATVVREVLQPTVELPTEAVDVIVIFRMLSEDLEPLEARGDADRMAVVGPRVERGVLPAAARLEDVHDLGLAPKPASWNPPPAILPNVVMSGRMS